MKKLTLIIFTSLFSLFSISQDILGLHENNKYRSRQKFYEETENEKKPLPLISFGTNLNTGSDAIGFRPSLVVSNTVTKGFFGMDASLKFTQVDDQEFDVSKTGQTLFINEISNFSANLGAVVGIPNMAYIKDKKTELAPRVGFTANLFLRGNSLFNLDSSTFKSEKNDIFTIALQIGTECVLMKENISVYCTYNYLSITNNRDVYHAYFPSNALKDFWYFQPGFRFKGLEGKDEFKGLIIDVSAIFLTNNMQVIAGSQNTIIPVIKIGYTKKIDWRNLMN